MAFKQYQWQGRNQPGRTNVPGIAWETRHHHAPDPILWQLAQRLSGDKGHRPGGFKDSGPRFSKFPELPVEIRIKIWKLVIDYPMILTWENEYPMNSLRPRSIYFPSPLAINKESRHEAKKAGYTQIHTTKREKDLNATSDPSRSFEGVIEAPDWLITFKPITDTLFLTTNQRLPWYSEEDRGQNSFLRTSRRYMEFDRESTRKVRSLALSFESSWDSYDRRYYPSFAEEAGRIDPNDEAIQGLCNVLGHFLGVQDVFIVFNYCNTTQYRVGLADDMEEALTRMLNSFKKHLGPCAIHGFQRQCCDCCFWQRSLLNIKFVKFQEWKDELGAMEVVLPIPPVSQIRML